MFLEFIFLLNKCLLPRIIPSICELLCHLIAKTNNENEKLSHSTQSNYRCMLLFESIHIPYQLIFMVDMTFKINSSKRTFCAHQFHLMVVHMTLKVIFQRNNFAQISQICLMVVHMTIKVISQRNNFAHISQIRLMVIHVTFKVIFQRNNFVLISQFLRLANAVICKSI